MSSWLPEPEVTEQADYERIGLGYGAQRVPDPRIAVRIWTALGSARTVINVGAGTGSYERPDRVVISVEPSATMRRERPPDRPPAVNASAESLPFDDGSFDAAMAIMTVHHWSDLDRGLSELRRVSRGPVVVMTFDPDALGCFWLARYAPELYQVERARFPTVESIRQLLGGECTVSAVAIPLDCTDGFAEAFYGRPEVLLDPYVRRAQSGWAFRRAGEALAVERLRKDLDDGSWDSQFGHLRAQPEFLGAIRIITASSPRQGLPSI